MLYSRKLVSYISLMVIVFSKDCKHGRYKAETKKCECYPHWKIPGITSATDLTGDFFDRSCSQYQCTSTKICQEITNLSNAECVINGWNCWCPLGHHGKVYRRTEYKMNSTEAVKCLYFHYWFSIGIFRVSKYIIICMARPLATAVVLFLPFGTRRRKIYHKDLNIMKRQKCEDNFSWSLHLIIFWVISYFFLGIITLMILFLWNLIIVILIIICLLVLFCSVSGGYCLSDGSIFPLCNFQYCLWGRFNYHATSGRNAYTNTSSPRYYDLGHSSQFRFKPPCFCSFFFMPILLAFIGFMLGNITAGYWGALKGSLVGVLVGLSISIKTNCWQKNCCFCFLWIPWLMRNFLTFPDNALGGFFGWIIGTHENRPIYHEGESPFWDCIVAILSMNWTHGVIYSEEYWEFLRQQLKANPLFKSRKQLTKPNHKIIVSSNRVIPSITDVRLYKEVVKGIFGVHKTPWLIRSDTSKNLSKIRAFHVGKECRLFLSHECQQKKCRTYFNGCGHSMCAPCMIRWISSSIGNECPMCRAVIGSGCYNNKIIEIQSHKVKHWQQGNQQQQPKTKKSRASLYRQSEETPSNFDACNAVLPKTVTISRTLKNTERKENEKC